MRYQLLGNSGLRVSELCLGTMTFGDVLGWGADFEESRRMFETFLEAGGNFVDTANNYTVRYTTRRDPLRVGHRGVLPRQRRDSRRPARPARLRSRLPEPSTPVSPDGPQLSA